MLEDGLLTKFVFWKTKRRNLVQKTLMFKEFSDVFRMIYLDYLQRDADFAVELVSSIASIRPYKMAPAKLKPMKDQLEEPLEKEFIRPSVLPWRAPVLLVRKNDDTLRMCIDYRKLN